MIAKITLIFSLLWLLPIWAQGDFASLKWEAIKSEAPSKILNLLDQRHNPFKDQTLTMQMTIRGGPQDGHLLEFTVITKDDGRRAIRFSKPADTKGMALVIKGDEIYVKLPGAGKVRRVAAHAKKQTFQGTTWSFDDMALIRLAPFYEPVGKIQDQGEAAVMDLKLKPGMAISYPKLKIYIDKSRVLISKIEYFDDKGEMIKVQTRQAPKVMPAGHVIYTQQFMKDLKSGIVTESQVLEEKIDQNIDDSIFTRRWLIRGL